MFLLKQQHPNVHACLALTDDSRRYLEIYIDHDKDSNDFVNEGLIFPVKALDDDAKLTKIKLFNIPLYNKEKVLEGLKQSLAIFGEIMDVGIFTDVATGFFMGSEYAVLNRFQAENTPPKIKYSELNHLISWCRSSNEIFRSTCDNMPMWCRYCHRTDHSKFECEVSKAKTLCYTRYEQGHRSFECPRKT